MTETYLDKIVIDMSSRTFKLYSSEGDYKEETCETLESFMNVLELVKSTVDEERISYSYAFYENKN